jgi:hypothetical protein
MIDPPLRFQFPSLQNIRIRGVFVMALCPKGLAHCAKPRCLSAADPSVIGFPACTLIEQENRVAQ